jgi:hypothetical protein
LSAEHAAALGLARSWDSLGALGKKWFFMFFRQWRVAMEIAALCNESRMPLQALPWRLEIYEDSDTPCVC